MQSKETKDRKRDTDTALALSALSSRYLAANWRIQVRCNNDQSRTNELAAR
ncbi:hypothetical protein [Pseudoalteromonas piscicida]|uniref:hypothetical protein n=1 Tax=Pseudoalteromonas piscicida TaxID=43662 RepID=UPI0012FE4D32|nr:hypothetical protein [Pseudoalteromonas piscicida]